MMKGGNMQNPENRARINIDFQANRDWREARREIALERLAALDAQFSQTSFLEDDSLEQYEEYCDLCAKYPNFFK